MEKKKLSSQEEYDMFSRKMFVWGAIVGSVMGGISYLLGYYNLLEYNYGVSLMLLVLIFLHIFLIGRYKEDEKKMKTIRYNFTINALFWIFAALIFLVNLVGMTSS